MKKILLRVYYWIIFILSLLFELISSFISAIDYVLELINSKLFKHLIEISEKIDKQ